MNKYEALAWMVDFIHLIVIVYWVGGFSVSKFRHPTFRKIHSAFGIVMFTLQLILSMRCPLVLVAGYLRELAKPGFTDNWLYRPFIVELLQKIGLQTTDILITVITAIGTALMIVTLLSLRKNTPTES
jgi:Ni/Fe-hydrogenase subunit HybB-like protein